MTTSVAPGWVSTTTQSRPVQSVRGHQVARLLLRAVRATTLVHVEREVQGDLVTRRRRLAEEWRATAARVDGSTPEFPRGTSLGTRLAARYLEGTREERQRSLL